MVVSIRTLYCTLQNVGDLHLICWECRSLSIVSTLQCVGGARWYDVPFFVISINVVPTGNAPATMMEVTRKLETLLTDTRHSKDLKTRLPLLRACGHLAARTPQHACRAALIELLLSQTPPSTVEDMHVAVGEALSLAFSGADSSVATGFLFTQQVKLSLVLKHVSTSGSSSNADNTEEEATLFSLAQDNPNGGVVYGAETVLKEKVLECSVKRAMTGSVAESAAAAVWLVSLLMFCGGDGAVKERLDKLQGAFVHLMGNASSDLAQVLYPC